MKRIVLANVYGDRNIGDATILAETLTLLNSAVTEKVALHMLCDEERFVMYSPKENLRITMGQLPYGYAIRSAGGRVSAFTKATRFMEVCLVSLLLVLVGKMHAQWLPRHGFYFYISSIRQADIVISIGGGYLRTKQRYKDYFGLLLTLLPLYIAKMYRKPLLYLPMSFGDFASSMQEKLSFQALTHATVLLRDKSSFQTIRELDRKKEVNAKYLPDLGIFYPYKPNGKAHDHDRFVVLTAREWLDSVRQKRFEAALAATVVYLWQRHKLRTVFVPMAWNEIEDDDNRVARRIQNAIGNNKVFVIAHPRQPQAVQDLLAAAHLAICTRMHAAILAYTVETPFITIAYEHKTLGFMQALGLTQWNINITQVSYALLTQRIKALLQLKHYQDFLMQLNNYRKQTTNSLNEIERELRTVLAQ